MGGLKTPPTNSQKKTLISLPIIRAVKNVCRLCLFAGDRVTPFSLLLERIYRDVGAFSGAKGAKEAIRSAVPR